MLSQLMLRYFGEERQLIHRANFVFNFPQIKRFKPQWLPQQNSSNNKDNKKNENS